ncbi:MAG: DUF3108 domain-containing protein [Rhodanobacter sp.]|nr:MAG: DUF3108 domain-containing protein [Rhodanobacter sp.]TAM13232.1 MAG: DUF3108 domain-containing protein [Rhodanobacter sp.]TAM35348.1 MAG: DUF3108 domain-containing protein [Rhodanobacter sp.]
MTHRLLLALALLAVSSVTAATSVPTAFTAHYRVLQGGQTIGNATVTLTTGADGTATYTKNVQGTAGLAALLGASTTETSHFRWRGAVPEAVSYDYRFRSAGKNKTRQLRVDWPDKAVTVDDGRHHETYAAQPGMVERNTLALAIGLALANGQQRLTLPVAVRQKVETQSFHVAGTGPVQVPAGHFNATRVERNDADKDFSAWYASARYPLPVKLVQSDGGNLTLELVSYSTP